MGSVDLELNHVVGDQDVGNQDLELNHARDAYQRVASHDLEMIHDMGNNVVEVIHLDEPVSLDDIDPSRTSLLHFHTAFFCVVI